jgi:drug/metabolite transporter (DMT)-like permease
MKLIIEELNIDDVGIEENTRLVQQNVPKLDCFKSLKGLCLVVISSLFSTIIFVLVKFITQISSSQINQIIFLQTTVYSLIIILITRDFYPLVISNETTLSNANTDHNTKNSFSKELLFLILSGSSDSISQFLYYVALKNLPVGEVTVFRLTTIIFVFLLGKIFLDEPIGYFKGLMLVLSIIGITLVSKVEFIFGDKNVSSKLTNESSSIESEQTRFYAILLMISGSFLSSIATIIKRKVILFDDF